jgi:hypothetical protein
MYAAPVELTMQKVGIRRKPCKTDWTVKTLSLLVLLLSLVLSFAWTFVGQLHTSAVVVVVEATTTCVTT